MFAKPFLLVALMNRVILNSIPTSGKREKKIFFIETLFDIEHAHMHTVQLRTKSIDTVKNPFTMTSKYLMQSFTFFLLFVTISQ
jgi:hypothetical protein